MIEDIANDVLNTLHPNPSEYMASSSSSRNWDYDVFLSFRGEDVRSKFRSHLLKELERKMIIACKDDEIMRSKSLWPELEKAIKNSRIALVIFSENYASSSWCLNELLVILNCKDQNVIPVFYSVDPSDVRKQENGFGRIFEKTCEGESKEKKSQWKAALTNVANKLGHHSITWNDEAKMIEDIANVVLNILLPNPSKYSKRLVGLEDHFAKMSELLQLESKEVKMVGIWGSSGIGKTSIARDLFDQLSRNFQVKKFIDKAFVNKSKEIYRDANPDDYNMKLHLQNNFLSEILGKESIEIDQLGAVEERLKHWKVLLIIDDLDDLMVLETLAGNLDWFGSGSRIIVVTEDRHFLKSHKIDLIYEVSLPTEDHAIEMLCQFAFNQKSPLDGFEEVVVKVVKYVGSLPIALYVLGQDLRQREKEYWIDMLRRIQNGEYSKIEEVLKSSYDGLESGDKTLFCYIACYFNHLKEEDIKFFLREDSNLYVYSGLRNLEDKSLIHVRTSFNGSFGVDESYVEMNCFLQEMGKKMTGPIKNPGEFLVDSKDILEVLTNDNCTQKVLGILWRFGKIDLSHFHEISFKGMSKLRYLKIDDQLWSLLGNSNSQILPEMLDYLPSTLELLYWSFCPLRYIAAAFSPENLVKLEMEDSELEELWDGVVPLSGLRSMNLRFSRCLKKIPNLSKATNLEELDFNSCWSLVELPSSIRNLNKLLKLDMGECKELKTIPTGFNLKSLNELNFHGCSKLTTFPEFSTNIEKLDLEETGIEEVPWWIETFSRLKSLSMKRCKNLRHASFNISKLKNLILLKLRDCGALTRVDMSGPSFSPPDNCVPKANLDFSSCYSLESLLQHQLFMFKSMVLPGKEVPSYFTHKTIGTSSRLAIPLLNIPHSQPFFRVKICVVLNSGRYSDIKLNFQFKGEFGNCFWYYYACFNPDPSIFDCFVEGSHLYIFDYRLPRYKDNAPADQRNYDHVNMKIHVDDDIIYNPQFGILLSEYGEDSYDSDMDLVTENGEEYRKYGDSDADCKTKNGEETGDNNIDRAKQGANPATQLLISKKRDSTFVDADEDGMLNLNEPIEECGEKHKKPRKVQQLTPFIPMLSPTLRTLDLLGISNLVELPYSFKNLHQLKRLCIRLCSNFKILPSRINLQSLEVLYLTGCSRLKSFPDISTNIEQFSLVETWIEEVPWWIENFSRLKNLYMDRCNNRRHASFNISKLKNLIKLNFRDCRALTRVDMCGPSFSHPDNCVPKAKLNFSNCYNLDPESLLQHQLFMFKSMILPGKEVPSYFTHKTIGTSSRLAIPLLNIPHSQPFFRVKICVVLNSGEYSVIELHFQFKGEFGNCYYCAYFRPWSDDYFLESSHLYIFDCRLPRYKDNAPADQRNYDHVNMKIHVDNDIYNQSLPKFGILLSEYGEDSYDSDMDLLVTENSEEYRENGDSDTDCETEYNMYEGYDNSDTDHKTKNGEETGDNNIDRGKQGANPATQLPISKKRDSTFVDADEDGMLKLNESPIEECGEKHKKPRKVSKD